MLIVILILDKIYLSFLSLNTLVPYLASTKWHKFIPYLKNCKSTFFSIYDLTIKIIQVSRLFK